MVIKKISILLLLGLLLVICFGACGTREEFLIPEPGEEETVTVEATGSIYVYVCGAVCAPGVYELPEGSRGDAALRQAGGFTEAAAVEHVNLAAVLKDGEKLYFPTLEEISNISLKDAGRININCATMEELCLLPGIGESRAADIISYREQYGEYETCEDIMRVSGIKQSVYDKIKDKIRID